MQNDRKITWLVVSVVWALTVLLVVFLEWPRIKEFGVLNLFVSWNSETTLPSLMLLILPGLAFLFPASLRSHRLTEDDTTGLGTLTAAGPHRDGQRIPRGLVLQSLVIAAFSFLASWAIGQTKVNVRTPTGSLVTIPFAELPPAYHDEFSYLLQAETFAEGRLAWPKAPVSPDLFHQFHVLNEDVTVSRYFPLTGLWIVPSYALGHPIWGHWSAGALAAVLFFWSSRMMMPERTAMLCGIFIAVSPGLAIFSNMLLAHHPVMLMLSVFLFAFLKLSQPKHDGHSQTLFRSVTWAFVSGCGLSAAMLGRPMTAAGFAAPFGAWLLWSLVRRQIHVNVIPAFALPLVGGFCFLAVLNQTATGDPLRTAYQEYTDNFTPRHKYGFDNALNCEIANGPLAVKKYDQWATNLSRPAAAENVGLRLKFSLFWTLNIVLLGLGLVAAFVELVRLGMFNRLPCWTIEMSFRRMALLMVSASVVSLHVVHIPYWYSGIMEWHYVFETAPLMLMLLGFGLSSFAFHAKRVVSSRVIATWQYVLIVVTIAPAWVSTPQVLGDSKVDMWINQMVYSRRRFAEFELAVASKTNEQAVLILIDEATADPQLSFIINPPDYSGKSLVCRLPRSEQELASLKHVFPDRTLFYLNAGEQNALLQPFVRSKHLPDNQ